MIYGSLITGEKCVYDLPDNIKTLEQFKSLIYGYNDERLAENQREELHNQPKLLGLLGPMWNGRTKLVDSGETVAVIRYETPEKYMSYD